MTILTSMVIPCYIIIALIIYKKFHNIGGVLIASCFATPFIVLAICLSFKVCYLLGTSLYVPEHNLGLFVSWMAVTVIQYNMRIYADFPGVNELLTSAANTMIYYGIYRFVMLFKPPS